jgi:hypothetical protein
MSKKTTQGKRINTQFSKEDFQFGDIRRITELSGLSFSMVYKVLRTGERTSDEVTALAKKYLAAKKKMREELTIN